MVDRDAHPIAQARALDEAGNLLGYSNAAGRMPPTVAARVARLERIGYFPTTVAVSSDTARSQCVVLSPLSYALPAVVIADVRSPALGQAITRETARRAPSLGEPDIFRNLPLAGAVTQVNDLRAAVHLAGGATDETGVTLDGHPLQWPFHAASALSAFNVSALERADVAIHHLAVDENDWLAGRIGLVPRSVPSEPVRELDVSLLSATATLGTRFPKDATMLVSGRVTYVGALLKRIAPSQGSLAPTYRDVLLRLAKGDSAGWSASGLAYVTHDDRSAESSGGTHWGEHLLGFNTRYAGSRWSWRARLSADEANVRQEDTAPGIPRGGSASPNTEPQHIALSQRWVSASSSAAMSVNPTWSVSVGTALDHRDNTWDWNSQNARTILSPRAPFVTSSARRQSRGALFTESTSLFPGSMVATGALRAVWSEGAIHVAPRVTIEAPLSNTSRVGFAAERRFQFDVIPEELHEGGLIPPIGLIDAPRRMDAISVSAVHEVNIATARRSLRGSVFVRSYADRPVLRATAATVNDGWPYSAFDTSSASSIGVSLTGDYVRASGLSLQATYTLQRVRETYADLTAPTSWDAPQNLSFFAAIPMGHHWSASLVGQLRSGAAYTPIEARILLPSLSTTPTYSSRLLDAARNSTRLPLYERLDVGIRRTWRRGHAEWGLSAQIINVFNRTNLLTYDWDLYFGCGSGSGCGRASGMQSLPLVPSLALQVTW